MNKNSRKDSQNRIAPSGEQILFDIKPVSKQAKQKQRNENDYVFDILDALTAPILTFSEQWADIIPKRLLSIVPLARMKALMFNEQLASYTECVIYIYTRSFESPMDHEWTDIYTHVSCKVLQDHFGEDHWNEVRAPRELNEWLTSKLTRLQQHIYQKRREILKKRTKEQEKKDEPQLVKSTKSKIVQELPSLFSDLSC